MNMQPSIAQLLSQAFVGQTPAAAPLQQQQQQAQVPVVTQPDTGGGFVDPLRSSEMNYASIADALRKQSMRADAEAAAAAASTNQNYENMAAMLKKSAEQAVAIEKQRTQALEEYKKEQRNQQVTAADMLAKEQVRMDEAKKFDQSLRQSIEERKVMSLDRGSAWSNMGTWDKARSMIGVVLGGIGQALTGANMNAGLAALEGFLDDDVMRQKSLMDSKDKEIKDKEGLFQKNMQMLGSEREASLLTKAMLRETYIDELASIAQNDESQQRKNNAIFAAQQLRGQQEKDLAEISNTRDARVVRNLQLQGDLIGRDQAGQLAALDLLNQQVKEEKKSSTLDIPGMQRTKDVTEEDAKIIKKLKGTHSQLSGINDRVRALREKIGENPSSTVLPDEIAAEAKGWQADLTAAVKEFKNMGSTFTDYEIALTEAMTYPSATSWKRVLTYLDRFQDSIDMELHTRAQAHGYKDIKVSPKFENEQRIKELKGKRVD